MVLILCDGLRAFGAGVLAANSARFTHPTGELPDIVGWVKRGNSCARTLSIIARNPSSSGEVVQALQRKVAVWPSLVIRVGLLDGLRALDIGVLAANLARFTHPTLPAS
jgi:hypothetical protein